LTATTLFEGVSLALEISHGLPLPNRAAVDTELRERRDQLIRLCEEISGGSRGLLGHSTVLLRGVVKLVDAGVDLLEAVGLLCRGRRDFLHEARGTLRAFQNISERIAGLVDEAGPCLDLFGALRNQLLDFARGIRGALRQEPDFGGDDGKPATCIACARRFDTGVQGEQVGLECDVVDHTDDARDLFGALFDPLHRLDGLPDDLRTALRAVAVLLGSPPPRPRRVRRWSAH
jgi:hypothetical protein